jgi:flagellar hook-length control protein FliK
VEAKADAQDEKSTVDPISVVHEDEPIIQDSPVKQVEPKDQIKAQHPIVQDEEPLPAAEQRPELNQRPDAVVAANGPGREAQAVEFNGKMPVRPFHAQAAQVAQQVVRQMKVNLKSGATSMHLQLNPKELGAIEVDMVSSSQGVQVTFFAEQASTGRLLETQLNQLRDSLIDSGVQLSGLNIGNNNTQGQKGGLFGQDTNFAPFTQQSLVENEVDEVPKMERNIRQASEVDYRI